MQHGNYCTFVTNIFLILASQAIENRFDNHTLQLISAISQFHTPSEHLFILLVL